jgi:hypothetical protein
MPAARMLASPCRDASGLTSEASGVCIETVNRSGLRNHWLTYAENSRVARRPRDTATEMNPKSLDPLEEFEAIPFNTRLSDEKYIELQAAYPNRRRVSLDPEENRIVNNRRTHCKQLLDYNELIRKHLSSTPTSVPAPSQAQPSGIPQSVEEAEQMGFVFVTQLLAAIRSEEFREHRDITRFATKHKSIRVYSPRPKRKMVHAAEFIRALSKDRMPSENAADLLDDET